MKAKFIFFVLFLLNFSLAQNLNKGSGINKITLDNAIDDIGTPICGTVFLNDDIAKQALENTRIHNPELYALMLKSSLEKSIPSKTADTVGTRRNFYVYNLVTRQFDYIVAELRAIGNLTQVWVDTTELNNGHVTQVEVNAILNALEYQTPPASRDPSKGIVALDHQYFGNPPNKDGDGKTDFLITDIKDGWQPGGSYVAGFFFSWDQTDNPGSNRRDILYIDSYPGIYYNNTRNPERPLSTLAHEYQHLIHYNYDRDEATFINEGLSEVAEVICGYPLRSPSTYFNNPDVPLFDWNNISGNVLADYARAALFTLYYTEQLGDGVLKRVVQEPANGAQGLNNVLSSIGAGYDFTQLLTNWFIANYLNDKTVDSKYGYTYPISGKPKEVNFHTDPNVNVTNQSVWGYAVDYIAFAYGESLKVTFTASSSLLKIKAIKLGQNVKQIVDVPIGTQFSVPEFGSTVTMVIFAVINTGSTSATYSYSSQGRQVAFYVETAYDDGTPDRFSGQANFLGFGNNRIGYGWAVKFVPEVSVNQLVNAKILAAFAQEFSGSNIPANAPKDFYFHVWSDNNGLPGNDIITPFVFSTNRPSYDGQFLTIDLSPYASQLKNLGTIYIGFTENDTIGTYVGMDSTTKTNYTYAFFGPGHPTRPNQWVPMENLQLSDGTSLRGWNMMMRATFAYTDTTRPTLVVGFFQNPIFSERLDVFVASQSKLNKSNLSGTLTQGSNVVNLVFQPVPNSNDKVFVDNNITLSSSGTIEIRVRGTTKYGFIYSDTAYTFNVQFLQSVSGGYIASTDGKMEVQFPRNSLKGDAYIIAFAGNSDVTNAEIDKINSKLSQIYTVSPVGYELTNPAILKIYLDPMKISSIPIDELTIAYWDGTKWVGLNSIVSSTGEFITAEINKLGHFIVTRKSEVTMVETPKVEIPQKFELYQNYPNPFNPSTSISFDLAEDVFVTLKIYNILGQEIRTLVNDFKPAGKYTVVWDGKDNNGNAVGSGIYLYKINAGKFTKTMKMVLAK